MRGWVQACIAMAAAAWLPGALCAQEAEPPLPDLDPAGPGVEELQAEELSVIQALPSQKKRAEAEVEDKHVVSYSHMFSVSGGDALRMGAIAQKADELRGQVNRLLKDDGRWKYTISIRLLGRGDDTPSANPIRTRIRIIGREPNLQIRIHPGGGIDMDRLSQAIISMVLFERAIRDVPPDALPEKLSMPPWLYTGMQQAIQWRTSKVDRRLYQRLFEQSEMLSPQEIISTANPAELDAGSRQIYDVSCGVLVLSLLNRPNGALQLRELLSEAVISEGKPEEIIGAHFVEMGINESLLSRWWAIELATLAEPKATDALTPMETEEKLAEALTVIYVDPETRVPRPVGVDDVYSLVELTDWQKLLRPCVDKLMALSTTCFPEYRMVIAEYCRVIAELQRGAKPDELQQLLGPLREIRQGYITSSIRGRDYLDWYEITHLGSRKKDTGFDAYREAMALLRKQSLGPETPLSRYLEDIEALYGLAEQAPLPKRMQQELQENRKNKEEAHGEEDGQD